MKLAAKLTFTHGLLIFAMLAASTAAYLSMFQVNRITSRFVSERVPVVRQAERLRIDLLKSSRALEQLMLFGADPTDNAYYRKRHHDQWVFGEAAMALLRDLDKHYDLGEDNTRIHTIDEQMSQLNDLENRIEALLVSGKPGDSATAYGLVHVQLGIQDKVVWDNIEYLIDSENNAMESESQEVHKDTRSIMWTLWITTFVSSIIGGLLAMIISRRISSGVRAVVARATAIAKGDLTGNDILIHSQDEVGILAQAMSTMQRSLRSIIGTVADTAGTLTASAVSMGASSEQITHRMDQQSQQTQQAAAALQEMSACIAEVSRHSQSAADTARSASKTAHEGGTIVKEMLASMHSIAGAVSETSTTISLLGEDSVHISHIVSVIEEIARKTNLLALNAAIEAARAGEQGRGFAVVAGEVRRLAESTAQATSEIAQMIQGIQERTRIAVAGMQSGTQTVQLGAATTLRAGEALTRIIDMAERVDRMIAQIAIATSQQAAAADESSASVGQMHALSDENLSEMRTSAAGIASLRETAQMLEEQVDRFRIENEDEDVSPLLPDGPYTSATPDPAFV